LLELQNIMQKKSNANIILKKKSFLTQNDECAGCYTNEDAVQAVTKRDDTREFREDT